MIKTFISYDSLHKGKKDYVKQLINSFDNCIDRSLDYPLPYGENEQIREEIRDKYITDATVLVVIATKGANGRKFIDWEIAAAMYDGKMRKDGKQNDICGIVVIDYVGNNMRTSSQKLRDVFELYEGKTEWTSLNDSETRNRYKHLPNRIVESMIRGAYISIIPEKHLEALLELALIYADATKKSNIGKYKYTDLRRHNSTREQ